MSWNSSNPPINTQPLATTAAIASAPTAQVEPNGTRSSWAIALIPNAISKFAYKAPWVKQE